MRLADEEELERAGVEARVHLQLYRPRRRSRSPDRPERPPHLEGRPSGTARMFRPFVEQQ